jgi:hypothetical protein
LDRTPDIVAICENQKTRAQFVSLLGSAGGAGYDGQGRNAQMSPRSRLEELKRDLAERVNDFETGFSLV